VRGIDGQTAPRHENRKSAEAILPSANTNCKTKSERFAKFLSSIQLHSSGAGGNTPYSTGHFLCPDSDNFGPNYIFLRPSNQSRRTASPGPELADTVLSETGAKAELTAPRPEVIAHNLHEQFKEQARLGDMKSDERKSWRQLKNLK
jgi:hypothetical protein